MQWLVELVMNSLLKIQIGKDNNESFYCKSETWIKKEYDENVLNN